MTSRRTRIPADLLLAALCLLLVVVATPSPPGPPLGAAAPAGAAPRRGGTLRVATMVNVRTLEPALAYDEASRTINEHLFARLLGWDAAGALVPDLAESFVASDGGLTYTATLRPGLRFHDGAPLAAQDVKRSLERTLAPSTPSPGASLYEMLVGFDAFRKGKAPGLEGIEVAGERTVRFRLAKADATFPALLTLGFAAPVCPSAGGKVSAKQPVDPCGAGPFRFVSWQSGERVRVARFEGYHVAGKPFLDGIEWQLNVPANTQRYRFERGELDYVRELTAADLALFSVTPPWSERGRWSTKAVTTGIFLNTELRPFDDVHVRRAVALAVDPSALGKVRANVAPADRLIPESLPGPPRDEPMRRHDLGAALREMAEAGYAFDPATGQGGYPQEIDYLAVPDSFDQSTAELFQQQLARIGLRIRLRLVSYATWQAEVSRRRTATMGWSGWQADFPDPANFFRPLLTSSGIQDEGAQNVSFFSSPELDALVEQAQHEQDHAARMELYLRAERIVRDQAPWVPIYVQRSFELWHPYVMGYEPHPIVEQRFTGVWLNAASPGSSPPSAGGRP